MGTNYYLHETMACAVCGRGYVPLHIGKSSAGWCFALRVDPFQGLHDLPDWEARWTKPGVIIQDEYARLVTPDEMKAIITQRVWERKDDFSQSWYELNHAMRGPNGLARSQLGGSCVKHGEGTWDCLTGDFS